MFTFVGYFRTRECSMSSLDLWISRRDSSRIRLVFSIAVLSIRSIETAQLIRARSKLGRAISAGLKQVERTTSRYPGRESKACGQP